ncbi:F-box only protein 47-like isoform X1 [Erpetoichthys calabaricus]|uniref:F-box only protein 47-like isoform X1 n=2 Tax=Erpetoichthys calabaricus TaxID=27687 RepID=UPI00223493F5|nr:F-box only protein 47-like isoform X1 [Erpetoichthys calabaricus]
MKYKMDSDSSNSSKKDTGPKNSMEMKKGKVQTMFRETDLSVSTLMDMQPSITADTEPIKCAVLMPQSINTIVVHRNSSKPTVKDLDLSPVLSTNKHLRRRRPQNYALPSGITFFQHDFSNLPFDVFYSILQYLSLKEISILSMVSKVINSYIVQNISKLVKRNRMALGSLHQYNTSDLEEHLEYYRSVGLLFKRCTLLLPTKERLKFISSQLFKVPCFLIGKCSHVPECLGFASYGAFLKVLIAGWDELECHRVFSFHCDFTNLHRRIQTVVSSKPGAARELEIHIRLFCRSVLIDPWNNQNDSLFWLTRILKPWPMVNQARLLYILYGPVTSEGNIDWQKMTQSLAEECSVVQFANAIKLIHHDGKPTEWTADSVIGLLEELTDVPNEWLLENQARLLLLCGNNICYTIMSSKAVNGRVNELANLMVFQALVCEKDGYHMQWLRKMLQKICMVFGSFKERCNLLQKVESVFCQCSLEILQSIIEGNQNSESNSFENLYSFLKANAHFHLEILYSFIKE